MDYKDSKMENKPRPKFSLAIWFGLPLIVVAIIFLASRLRTHSPPPATATVQPTRTATSVTSEPASLLPRSPTPRRPTSTPSPPTPTAYAILQDVSTPTPTVTPSPFALTSGGDTLSPLPSPVPAPPTPTSAIHIRCTVGVNVLNLREGPGTSYGLIRTLPTGASLSVLKRAADGSWLLVETEQQQVGWVYCPFVTCQGDLADLPVAHGVVVQSPALPTATATPPLTPTSLMTPGPPLSLDSWRAEYYDNASLLGEPVLIREDPLIDFNWILDSPAPNIPADNFSVRWTRLFDFFEGGDYRFFAEADDGIRIYVDGWLVIDAWHTSTPTTHSGSFADIQAGIHTITVEYFESGGHAHVKVWAEKTLFVDAQWRGEYYDNSELQEPVFLIRQDESIDFDWDYGSPAEGMDGNHFSVRWKQTLFFDGGDYKFVAEVADRDRVRIYLDDWLIVDQYKEESGTVKGHFGNLGAGYHTVVVEYQEQVGRAEIRVWWERQ